MQGNDIGGSSPGLYSVFQIHGGRRNEGQVQLDGMSAGYQGMGVSGYVPEVGNSQEVVFSLAGGLGEAVTGGPQLNVIGKQGGNMFAGSFFINGTGSGLQGENLTDEIKAKGLTATNSFKQVWDVNPSFGGPIVRDKVWFFATFRYQYNDQYVASMWANKNVGDRHEVDLRPGLHAAGHQRRQMEEHVGAADVASDATQQDQRLVGRPVFLPPLRSGRRRFGAWLRSADQVARRVHERRKSPELVDAVELDLADQLASLARSERAAGTLLLVGLPAEECVRQDVHTGAGRCRPHPHHQLPVDPLVRAHGDTNIIQGSASYVTGSHSAKFGARYLKNDSNVSEQLLQRFAAQ